MIYFDLKERLWLGKIAFIYKYWMLNGGVKEYEKANKVRQLLGRFGFEFRWGGGNIYMFKNGESIHLNVK